MDNDRDDILEEDGMEFSADLITLVDEDGIEHEFELIETIEHAGSTYVALLPSDILEEDQELVIMKIIIEDGEEVLELLEDDDEFDEVSEIFEELLSDLYEFEDMDEEDEDEDED